MSVNKELITTVRCCWNCKYKQYSPHMRNWICCFGGNVEPYTKVKPANLCPFHEDNKAKMEEKSYKE